MILRILAILCMYGGSIYYIVADGVQAAPLWDFKNQIPAIGTVFGNTVFVFVYHHSVSGIIYPARPQKQIKKTIALSHFAGFFFLGLEGILAFLAFSGLTNDCTTADGQANYPCKVQPLYNENFLGIPGLGEFVNFYPFFNIGTIPVLLISLRNNILEVVPIKRWLREKQVMLFLLDVLLLPHF